MGANKGKPSGNDAEKKSDIGRKRENQRTGWPEDAPTQRIDQTGEPAGKNRKAGSPI
jgi:hypothetical protein